MQGTLASLGANASTVFLAVTVLVLCPTARIIYLFVRYVIYVRRIGAVVDQCPGTAGHWFWGHIFEFPGPGEKGIAWSMDLLKRFPKYHGFYAGWWRPGVQLKHPDCIKALLKTAQPKAMSGGGGYSLLIPWLGHGLLLSSGPKWFRNRKLLTPGFHFDVLKPYVDVYHHAANKLICKFEAAGAGGDSVEVFKPVSLCTLDVMLRCAFTFDSDVQADDNQYVAAVNSIAGLIMDRAFKPWMYLKQLYYRSANGRRFKELCDYVHGIADQLISARRASIKDESTDTRKKYVDFLDILLLAKDENGAGLSDEEIRNEVDTFLFEGHDTTSSAISWILYTLAKHPEAQRKCQEEVASVLDDVEHPHIGWDNLHQLPFLTQCIKEGMRLYPPVPSVMRQLESPLEIDGRTFLPGTIFQVPIFILHHNPEVWGQDAEDFRPERFETDRMEKMDSHAFLPFSAGPRNCIGQNFAMHEIKVIIGRVLHCFQLSVDTSHPIERLPIMTMRAKHGIKLFFKPRR